jgi:sigma-B regulation protein RsbU (phosphoserine phosphatase)
MATHPRPESAIGHAGSEQEQIRSLLLLHEASQKISSILDLDVLVHKIVNEVAVMFGCNETSVWLRDTENNEMVLQGVVGCSMHKKGMRLSIGLQGMIGHVAATGHTRYAPDVRNDPFYIGCEEDTRSELDIPLISNGEVVGVFSANCSEVDAFNSEQRMLLQIFADHIASAVQNARVFTRDRSERDEARAIQVALFPRSSPLVDHFQIDGHCITAGDVGGDWYDYFRLPDGRIALVLADVSGKGMPAALLMSSTRGILRTYASATSTMRPADLLTRLNRILMEDLPPEKFVTMVLAVLDPRSKTLTLANAGHPFPILVNNTAEFIKGVSGIPLGIADREYTEETFALSPGSRLLLYSDGISEAANQARKEYGPERLRKHALRKDLSVESVLADVNAFTGSRSLADDATVVLVQAR